MEYKRLTDKDWHKEKFYFHSKSERTVIKRLWDLENKIENGTLIELPCKVGDTVYIATHLWAINKVVEAKVSYIEYSTSDRKKYIRIYTDHEYVFSKTNPNLIENRYIFFADEIFLTREEAEKRLEDLQK